MCQRFFINLINLIAILFHREDIRELLPLIMFIIPSKHKYFILIDLYTRGVAIQTKGGGYLILREMGVYLLPVVFLNIIFLYTSWELFILIFSSKFEQKKVIKTATGDWMMWDSGLFYHSHFVVCSRELLNMICYLLVIQYPINYIDMPVGVH